MPNCISNIMSVPNCYSVISVSKGYKTVRKSYKAFQTVSVANCTNLKRSQLEVF